MVQSGIGCYVAILHCVIVRYMLANVMFAVSLVTCMAGWTEIEIFLLVILNNSSKQY